MLQDIVRYYTDLVLSETAVGIVSRFQSLPPMGKRSLGLPARLPLLCGYHSERCCG